MNLTYFFCENARPPYSIRQVNVFPRVPETPVSPVQAVRYGFKNGLKIQMKFGNFKIIRCTLRGVPPNNLAYCNAFHI